jgi:hypothetical protein
MNRGPIIKLLSLGKYYMRCSALSRVSPCLFCCTIHILKDLHY